MSLDPWCVLDSKLLKLEKIHTNDDGLDMMTNTLPKGKFETCQFISGLTFALSWVGGGVCSVSPSQVKPNNILF